MQYEQFIAGRKEMPLYEHSGDMKEQLEQADAWQALFARVLTDHLENPELRVPTEVACRRLDLYATWTNAFIPRLLAEASHETPAYGQDYILNRNNFHILNAWFTEHWYRLMTGASWDETTTKRTNRNTQDALSIYSLQLQKQRKSVGNAQYYDDSNEEMARHRGTIEGMLNEYDCGIVLLADAMKHPERVVVPAPAQFEHGPTLAGTKRRNADFIVLDTTAQEVIGAQAKIRVTSEEAAKYDSQYVFIVDGDADLNSIMSRLVKGTGNNGHSTRFVTTGRAGSIAATHVMNWPSSPQELHNRTWLKGVDPTRRAGLKFFAKELKIGNVEMERFTRIIAERTMYHLKKPVTTNLPAPAIQSEPLPQATV